MAPPTTWSDVIRALGLRPPARVSEPVGSHAAVSLVLRQAEPGLELLFIHRAEHPDDRWSGQMAFPGGRAEPGEDDLTMTAVRETAEETGVDLRESGELLGALDEMQAMARGRHLDLAIRPFVFRLAGRPVLCLSNEVRGAYWIPLDGLMGRDWRSTMEYAHDGSTFQLPCIRWGGPVIWGLTFRMLQNLETLLGEVRQADPRGEAAAVQG